ncbi:carboxylesterase/lipase family protein [Ruania albidiflava]|uniref:carboxylesterase/lipase family protein n=1 Tax=Ruania albidiflava TaxID=366586 RepID=UPI0003B4C23C|nr:carboxylesterase family protein [Ruania albidiflava]
MTETVVADTTSGRVRGVRRERSIAFRGIPYAAAPVGELRFQAPAPHPGWDGVRDALANGPTPSLGPTGDTYSIPEPVVPGDEVLNLNVFTPTLDPAARLPVHVWVHGGGFVGGSPGGAWFDGDSFAGHGVVTVAITYRLGFEGYGDVPGAPGNRALRDVIAALQWVAQNIAGFGGDPDQVTIGGQSAGGSAVLALLVSPVARGLFRSVVCHSGPLPDIPLARARRVGAEMARTVGVEHTVAGWRDVPREQVVAAERAREGADLVSAVRDLHQVLAGRDPITDFGPVIGDEVLPDDPVAAIAGGAGGDVPLLLGTTSHEFNRITAVVERYLASGVAGAVLMGLGVPPVLARAYPRAYPDFSPAELLGQAVTDRVFRMPAVQVAQARAAAGSPAWLWDFRWRSPVTDRAVHCVDLPFAWQRLGVDRVARIAGEDPPVALAEELHGAVVQLVREGRAGWPVFTSTEPVAKVWDTPSWVGRDPYRFERIAVQQLAPEPAAAT